MSEPPRQSNRIEHAVLVYMHKTSGLVCTRYAEDASDMAEYKDYVHVATLDPALWIEVNWGRVLE